VEPSNQTRKHPLAECERCPLYDRPYVPSKFPASGQASIVFAAEAPGFKEVVYKEPFKGPSGNLLNEVMKYHGIKRQDALLTNVVSCRPEDNGDPPKEAVHACRPRLLDDIRRSGARDVVALGGAASNSLVDDPRTITALRVGPPKKPTGGLDGSAVERVLPTWHPAYCLRNADAFPSLMNDVGKLTRTTYAEWKEPYWRYSDEEHLAIAFLEWLLGWQETSGRYELVIDIEVGIEKDTAFDHPNNYELLSIGLCWQRNTAHVLGEEALKFDSVRQLLDRLLRRSKLIGHNGKFDLAGLYPLFPRLELWFDTMLAHYALDERAGIHGLKMLAVELLGAPAYDDEIKQYVPRGGSYAAIPRAILYKYNAYDVACTWALYELFTEDMERQSNEDWPYEWLPVKTLRDWHDFLVKASNQLMYLELNGIAIDKPYNTKLQYEYLARLEEIEKQLDTIVSVATDGDTKFINPRSPKQVKAFLATQRIQVETTNKEMLERLVDRVATDSALGQFLRTLLDHRRQQKLYGTYVKGIRRRLYRGRVYTTYLLHGTTSGRLASRNPNLQNIVRDKSIRRQFSTTVPDNVLIQADYKQAEGRVVATLAQDEFLRDMFADEEVDLFNNLADQFYGEGTWGKEERVRIKAFFYGLAYGREAPSIAMEYGWSLGETQKTLRDFMALMPAVAEWQSSIRRHVLSEQYLVTPFGRRRRFSLITDQNRKDVLNEALSYLPQSTASDICLSALIELRPLLRGLGFIRLTIHDALVVECHRDREPEVAELLRTTMVDVAKRFTDYVPFAVDVTSGTSWGDL
jgi:uracil-DNA glycosylase family 4